jgi:hypothetical protein
MISLAPLGIADAVGDNRVAQLLNNRWHLSDANAWYTPRRTSHVEAMTVLWLLLVSVVVDWRPDV